MRTQMPTTSFFTAISRAYMMRLTEEVKETLAVTVTEKKDRILSAADVWNIQRNKRSRGQRKFF